MAEKMDYNRENIAVLRFWIGGFLGNSTEITIKRNEAGALVHVSLFPYSDEGNGKDIPISEDKWNNILSELHDKIRFQEWKKNYENLNVLDGTQWEFTVTYEDKKKRNYGGSNAYPPRWKEFCKLFQVYAGIKT